MDRASQNTDGQKDTLETRTHDIPSSGRNDSNAQQIEPLQQKNEPSSFREELYKLVKDGVVARPGVKMEPGMLEQIPALISERWNIGKSAYVVLTPDGELFIAPTTVKVDAPGPYSPDPYPQTLSNSIAAMAGGGEILAAAEVNFTYIDGKLCFALTKTDNRILETYEVTEKHSTLLINALTELGSQPEALKDSKPGLQPISGALVGMVKSIHDTEVLPDLSNTNLIQRPNYDLIESLNMDEDHLANEILRQGKLKELGLIEVDVRDEKFLAMVESGDSLMYILTREGEMMVLHENNSVEIEINGQRRDVHVTHYMMALLCRKPGAQDDVLGAGQISFKFYTDDQGATKVGVLSINNKSGHYFTLSSSIEIVLRVLKVTYGIEIEKPDDAPQVLASMYWSMDSRT